MGGRTNDTPKEARDQRTGRRRNAAFILSEKPIARRSDRCYRGKYAVGLKNDSSVELLGGGDKRGGARDIFKRKSQSGDAPFPDLKVLSGGSRRKRQ